METPVLEGVVLSFPISKVDEEKMQVWGYATTEDLDSQREIVDYDAAKKAFQEWTDQFNRVSFGESLGNVREMHQPKPVGKVIAWQPDDVTRKIWVGAQLSRTKDGLDAWQKVKEHVLNGFSIGAPTAERRQEFLHGRPVNRVTKLTLSELSLVDNPACPGAFFQSVKLAKAAGGLIEVNAAMDGITSTSPQGSDWAFKPGLEPNAFVDGAGQVWKMHNGTVKIEPVETSNKEAAAMESELEKGKKIGPHTRPDAGPPGPEKPKVTEAPESGIPKATAAKDALNEGKPGGPHATSTTPVTPPDGQGKSAEAFPPQAPPPAPPQAPHQQPMAGPGAPPAPPAKKPFSYCAYCAGKLADGSNPAHPSCEQPAPAMPGAYSAAAIGEALQKAFGGVHEGIQKLVGDQFISLQKSVTDTMGAFAARVEKIEKVAIPGGPQRTELPEGVAPVEKGGGSAVMTDRAVLEKAIGIVDDPFLKDKLSRQLAKSLIMQAQGGGKQGV
jgi:phage head maturation protease